MSATTTTVLLIVTHLEDDQIRVNAIRQKLKDGENAALTTPLTVTGTSEELDRVTLVKFVGAHLGLKNTRDQAKLEIDAAAKPAKAEARSKVKTPGKRPLQSDHSFPKLPCHRRHCPMGRASCGMVSRKYISPKSATWQPEGCATVCAAY